MTQVWDENDNIVPSRSIQAGPCTVSQVKTGATDGTTPFRSALATSSQARYQAHGWSLLKGWRRARPLPSWSASSGEEHKVGDVVTVADFENTAKVDVIGTSKGKGFQGRIKRWGQRRGPMTHGSHFHRHSGSIGQCAYPARVLKGVKINWPMGNERDCQEPFRCPHRCRAEPHSGQALPRCQNGLVAIV